MSDGIENTEQQGIASDSYAADSESLEAVRVQAKSELNDDISPQSLSGQQYVYALGRVEPRFPSLSVEKEFAQVTRDSETSGLTDRQATHSLLSDPANRYLARELCWVFTIEGLETYILFPRDSADLDLLINAVRPNPRATDIDVVVGMRGPLAPPDACDGLMVPVVIVDQLYSFDVDSLMGSLPRPDDADEEQFSSAAEDLLARVMRTADNAGATDIQRALNYLVVRYPGIYHRAARCFQEDKALNAVNVQPSRLSGPRKIVDVVFSYTHRETDVTEKYFVRVDVTEKFPFLVTKLSPYFDLS